MKRVLRWIGISAAGLVAAVLVAYGIIYALSERAMRRTYPAPASALTASTDPASVAEGQRLATLFGCYAGCHGKQAEGAVLFDQPNIARIVAPNLTLSARKYTDGQLDTIIRHGVRPNGHSTIIMPSEDLVNLTDADVASVLGFLRSLPAEDGPGPSVALGPLGRIGLAGGKFKLTAELMSEGAAPPMAASAESAHGRYLAQVVCGHCHGADLRGASNPDFTTPGLQVVAGYSPEALTQLLRTGEALGGRELRVMSAWARTSLVKMTDGEIADVYRYLRETAEVAQ